jgi:hypothetical protein
MAQSLDRIETVLWRESMNNIWVYQRRSHNAPVATTLDNCIFGENSLMGAMESAQTQMHNAWL